MRSRATHPWEGHLQVCPAVLGAGEKSHLNPIRYGFDVLAVVRNFRRGKYHAL